MNGIYITTLVLLLSVGQLTSFLCRWSAQKDVTRTTLPRGQSRRAIHRIRRTRRQACAAMDEMSRKFLDYMYNNMRR